MHFFSREKVIIFSLQRYTSERNYLKTLEVNIAIEVPCLLKCRFFLHLKGNKIVFYFEKIFFSVV